MPIGHPQGYVPQNQHYVPKFILRNFLGNEKKEQVHVFSKRDRKGFITSINNIMAERRFHDFQIGEHHIATFEAAVCEVEKMLLPAYRAVLESGKLSGTPEEKGALVTFIAFQYVRTRAQRDMFDQMMEQLGERIAEMGGRIEDMEGYVPPTDASRKLNHIEFIKKATGDFALALADKDLLLMRAAPGRSFYLSDNPVALHNDQPRDGLFGNLGLMCKGIQVYLPLSANLMLCAWCPSLIGEIRANDAAQKRDLAAFMLSPRLAAVPASDELEGMLNKLRPLRQRIERWIKAADEGKPLILAPENMDFQNSLQIANASNHVICKQADFALAQRFMKENPHHQGLRMTMS